MDGPDLDAFAHLAISNTLDTPKWKSIMQAHNERFLARLPYFETIAACELEITTEVDSDEQQMMPDELARWKAVRAQERIAHDDRIKERKKNIRVEAALQKITTNDEAKALFKRFEEANLKQRPIQKALVDLGYDADVERLA